MSRFRWFLAVTLLGGHALPAVAQDWVAQVKSAPQDYRERVIRLEGDVVELRGATPISIQGLYRLVDASDPTGVLLRTTSLPETSGPFKIRARLSPELLFEGALLLEEIERAEPFQPLHYVPGILTIIGLALTVVFGVFHARARKNARHQHLAPPMWLIPTETEGEAAGAGTAAEGGALPAVRFNYRLQYVAEERSAALDRAKRRTLGGMAGASMMMALGFSWWMVSRAEASDRPTFVLLTPEVRAEKVLAGGDSLPLAADDSATVPLAMGTGPARPPASRPETPTTPRPRATTAAPGRDTATTAQNSATVPPPPPATQVRTQRVQPQPLPPPAPIPVTRTADTSEVAQDSIRTVQVPVQRPVVTPRVTPPPAAAPPPPPPPDPAVERAAAARVLTTGGAQLVAAINAGQLDRVSSLYLPTGDRAWLTRLLNHIRDTEPTAAQGSQSSATLTGDEAEAEFVVSMRWRGNFGVARNGDARFVAVARRSGETWRLVGVRLVQRFP